jgi:hypothetical protein
MSIEHHENPEEEHRRPVPPGGDPGAFTQEVQHSHVSARVPEKVGRGVFCTGAMVFQGPNEFVIDFILRMANPHHVAARVVLPHPIMPNVLNALRENLSNFVSKFGPPPPLPQPPQPVTPPPIDEIYSQLKLPDDMLSGVYANAVMIAHSPAEFYLDFITNFYPRSAVSCRVYMSAQQMPGFVNTMTRAFQQFQQKMQQQHKPPESEGYRND